MEKACIFDLNSSKKELGYMPVYSNNQMFRETYDWYCENRNDILSGDLDGSQHQSAIKHKILRFLPYFFKESLMNVSNLFVCISGRV